MRTLGVIVGSLLIAAIALVLIAWRPAIPTAPPAKDAFAPAQVAEGAQLAAIGNCRTCHTRDDGPAYAGGRPIATPFGTIFSTNVTPDRETGIGAWPEAAFVRAMRDGVSRDGHHLYPAFPYDHMTRMHDDDIRAVYAFLQTRPAVEARAPANDLPFPLNIRLLIAGWKLLFLDRGKIAVDGNQSPEWNRGAYLVEGLAHCGACHTPRNVLGAEKKDEAYGGGMSDGWVAPALNAASPAAVPWDAEHLHRYLRRGFEPRHGIAAGPMMPVVENLAAVPDADVRAIAVYVAGIAGEPSTRRQHAAETVMTRATHGRSPIVADNSEGATLYATACAQCHGEAGRLPTNPALNLTLSTPLRVASADNLVRIVRDGIKTETDDIYVMPGFAGVLSDAQVVALAAYLRGHFTDRVAWTEIDKAVRRARDDEQRMQGAQEARIAR